MAPGDWDPALAGGDNGDNNTVVIITVFRLDLSSMNFLPYDPGPLPTRASPVAGEELTIRLSGLPPYKDGSHSIRNVTHPRYDTFLALRRAAIEAMDGRAWYAGPVALDLVIHAPKLHKNRNISDYASGVEDTLGGSSGYTFTCLPIAFEDDCQVFRVHSRFVESTQEFYELRVRFLDNKCPEPIKNVMTS